MKKLHSPFKHLKPKSQSDIEQTLCKLQKEINECDTEELYWKWVDASFFDSEIMWFNEIEKRALSNIESSDKCIATYHLNDIKNSGWFSQFKRKIFNRCNHDLELKKYEVIHIS